MIRIAKAAHDYPTDLLHAIDQRLWRIRSVSESLLPERDRDTARACMSALLRMFRTLR